MSFYVNTETGEVTDDLQAVETWTTCDTVPLDAVQELTPLLAALWDRFRKLKGGRTWEQFQELRHDHVKFNQFWCFALGLPNWKEGKPPPLEMRGVDPNTGEIFN